MSGADERTGSVERVERRARDAAVEAALVERCFRRTLTDLGVLDRLDPGRSTLLEYLQVAGELERVASLAADLSRAAYGESPPDPSPEALADCAQRTRLSIEHATDAALSDVSLERAREARRCATAVESLASDSPDSRTWFRALDALERTADCATVVGSHAVRSALRREG